MQLDAAGATRAPAKKRPEPPQYIRVKEAAARLNLGESTIWRWVKTKPEFPKPIKVSARVTLLPVAELDAFMARQREATA